MKTLFKNTGTATQVWSIKAVDGGFQIVTQRNLNGKEVVKFHPVKQKNVGRANETSIEEQTHLEINSRIKKQFDKGYVETIEAASKPATNTLNLVAPMLAKVYEKEAHKIDYSKPIFVQPKLDGHRAMYKDGVLYSRGGKEINLQHIKDALANIVPAGTHLDGELYCHGLTLQEIGSLVKKPREESLVIQYYVYDVVMDKPYSERIKRLEEIIPYSGCSNEIVLQTPTIEMVLGSLVIADTHKHFLSLGYEGTMVRHGDSPYAAGKRSDSLLKLKDFQDSEFLVVDKKLGISIVEGLNLTIFVCKMDDGRTFEATAPGTAEEKHAAWFEDNIGKTLTVKHFGYSDDGIPLLPVALRWREDI